MNNELYHHGILGQKWGVRRYQNMDGSLTEEGRVRYGYSENKTYSGLKKAMVIGAVVAASGLAAYGAYKYYELNTNSTNAYEQMLEGRRQINQNWEDIGRMQADDLLNQMKDLQNANNFAIDPNKYKNFDAKKVLEESGFNKVVSKAKETAEKDRGFHPEDFKFVKLRQSSADGSYHDIELPLDKNGYSKSFAASMSKNDPKQYEYWYNYMLNKLDSYGNYEVYDKNHS